MTDPGAPTPPEPTRASASDRAEERIVLIRTVMLAVVTIVALVATVLLLIKGREADAVAPSATAGMGMLAGAPRLTKSRGDDGTGPSGGGSG